jgi:putative tricarboxylic transport membrane protein
MVGATQSKRSERGMSRDLESVNGDTRRRIRIRGPREFYGGLALMALALFAFWASSDLPVQAGIGPGTFPRAYAGLLLALSAVVAGAGLIFTTPAIGRYAVRGPVLIVISIAGFALLVRPFGLAMASFFTFMAGALASAETRWREAIVAAIVLTAFCCLLFAYLLGLSVQVFPDWPS